MSKPSNTFVHSCLVGGSLEEDIDDWVQCWHDHLGAPTGEPVSLDDYLGFSEDEGKLWAERPEALRFILAARQRKLPLVDVLAGETEFALAARATDPEGASGVLAWLHQTGRLSAQA